MGKRLQGAGGGGRLGADRRPGRKGQRGGEHGFGRVSQLCAVQRIVFRLIVGRDAGRHAQGDTVAVRVAGRNHIDSPIFGELDGLVAVFVVVFLLGQGGVPVLRLDQVTAAEFPVCLFAHQGDVHVGFEPADEGLRGRRSLFRGDYPKLPDTRVHFSGMDRVGIAAGADMEIRGEGRG